jgi:Peptidase family M23
VSRAALGILAAALAGLWCASLCPEAAFSSSALSVSLSPPAPEQGDPVLVEVSSTEPVDNAVVVWQGTAWPLREVSPGRFEGLIGVDLLAPPHPATVGVEAFRGGEAIRIERTVMVRMRRFPVQELSLPRAMAEFDAPTLRRIREEAKGLADRFARVSRPVLWRLPFLPPVEEFRPSNFGSRRIINGEPRMPHAGVDIHVPAGTPVRAIAAGRVAFAGDQFFGGRSVVIDHGGGVFSIYYHLMEYSVTEGQAVTRGERIGAVGSTGRATGPHLHFGVRVAGGRVDPSHLFALPAQ